MTTDRAATSYRVAIRSFLGGLAAYGRDPLEYLSGLGATGADLLHLTLGPYRAAFVNHPDLASRAAPWCS
ncbi:MAG: hypothetical protein FJ034_00955 [Chloroflexi bacterium]|nr:hypothetical protein [Chloroflexota bacterium]